jgi:hypothetical protein
LKKAAADAARDAAGVKKAEPAASSSSSSNLVITADRLSAVMAAMVPIMADAEREAASRAASAEYNKKRKVFESCIETQSKAMGAGTLPTTDGMMKSAAISEKSVDMLQRSQAAHQARRYREYLALTDSMTASGSFASLAMFNLDTKCGAYPYKPAVMLDLEASKMSRASTEVTESGSNLVSVAPANRGGMSTYQFGMIRERAILWALQQTNNAPVGDNRYSVFTAEEQSVLEAQGAQLKKWALILKDQPSRWATWTDIAAW